VAVAAGTGETIRVIGEEEVAKVAAATTTIRIKQQRSTDKVKEEMLVVEPNEKIKACFLPL